MDASSSASRPEFARTDSAGNLSQRDKTEDKTRTIPVPTLQRTTRYKEKFLSMKERYEVVTAAHDQYERELLIANEKLKKLQSECDLLLDAVDIAVPGQPTLLHYLKEDPLTKEYLIQHPPPPQFVEPSAIPPPLMPEVAPPIPPSRTHSHSSAPHTNGTNGHTVHA